MNIGIEASSWINIVAGLALVGLVWYDTTTLDATFYSALVAGIVLVAAGVWTAWDAARNEGRSSRWVAGICLIAGVAIFAYPWFVNVPTLSFWTAIVVGGVVALASAYETYVAFQAMSVRPLKGRVA